jgi:hypothetical protein
MRFAKACAYAGSISPANVVVLTIGALHQIKHHRAMPLSDHQGQLRCFAPRAVTLSGNSARPVCQRDGMGSFPQTSGISENQRDISAFLSLRRF